MSKFDKAVDFYLRGFNGQYIKRRTDISIQSLLKTLKAQGIVYSKSDIVRYQVSYIKSHFSRDEIIREYKRISQKYPDLYKAGHSKKIECLGCGFGQHAKVFRILLGDDVYNELRNQCWYEKQQIVVQQKYGVDNVFRKEVFDTLATKEAISEGRKKRTATMIERYGVEQPNQNESIKQRMQQTMRQTKTERDFFIL